MSAMLPVTAWTIAAAVLTGLLLALLGSLKLAMARRPERVTGPVSLLLLLLNIALLPLLIVSGLLVDLWGLRPMMIAGPVLLALALLALSARPAYYRTQIAVLCAAAAATSLATTSAALMPRALFGEEELVASFLLGMVFVALGALAAAPLVDLLFRGMGFRRTMAILALVALVPAFVAALAAPATLAQVPWRGGIRELIDEPSIWLGALVFFFYAPLEGFVSVWTTKYLESLGKSPRQATNLLVVFWSSLIISRLLMAWLQHGTNMGDSYAYWFLIVPSLLIAVVLGNLAAMTRISQIGSGLFLLGLCMGPLIPLLLGQVFGKQIQTETEDTTIWAAMPGTAYAILCAGGSLGGLVLSPVVGFCARAKSLPGALLIPTFVALVLTASAVVFSLQTGR